MKKFAIPRMRGDEGVALPLVLSVFLVCTVLVTTFFVSTVGAVNVSAATESSIQVRSSAESGIEDAKSRMQAADPCTLDTWTSSASEPVPHSYSVTVECMGPIVKVTSVGDDSQSGGDGNHTNTVEAVFELKSGLDVAGVERQLSHGLFTMNAATGAAGAPGEFVYDKQRSTTASTLLPNAVGSAHHVAGDSGFTCSTHEGTPGNIVAPGTGNIQINSGCVIAGDIYTGGRVTVAEGGTVKGDIIASNPSSQHSISGTVGTSSSGGNIQTAGSILLFGGTVNGNVLATGDSWSWLYDGSIGGDFTYKSGFNASMVPISEIVAGSVTKNSDAKPPSLPAVAPWENIEFVAQDWKDAGFSIEESYPCAEWVTNAAASVKKLNDATSPTVFDLRKCGAPGELDISIEGSHTLNLKTDIVIVADQGRLSGIEINSASDHSLYLIGTDAAAAPAPSGVTIYEHPFQNSGYAANPGATAHTVAQLRTSKDPDKSYGLSYSLDGGPWVQVPSSQVIVDDIGVADAGGNPGTGVEFAWKTPSTLTHGTYQLRVTDGHDYGYTKPFTMGTAAAPTPSGVTIYEHPFQNSGYAADPGTTAYTVAQLRTSKDSDKSYGMSYSHNCGPWQELHPSQYIADDIGVTDATGKPGTGVEFAWKTSPTLTHGSYRLMVTDGHDSGFTNAFAVGDVEGGPLECSGSQEDDATAGSGSGSGSDNSSLGFSITGLSVGDTVSIFASTPGKVTIGRTEFRGQVVADKLHLSNSAEVAFWPVTVPGQDFLNTEVVHDTSGNVVQPINTVGALVSQRNVE